MIELTWWELSICLFYLSESSELDWGAVALDLQDQCIYALNVSASLTTVKPVYLSVGW